MTSPARDATEIVPFDFHGDALDVARLPDGDVGVSLRRLCQALNLDDEGQRQRLARGAALGARWATACMMTVVAADGRFRDMLVLPRRSIPMWAATVDASRVPEEVRAKLVAYQDEAADALAARFVDGVRPGAAPLTRATALKFLVDEALVAGKPGAAVAFLNAARSLDKGQLPLPGVDVPSPLKPRSLRAYHDDILAALAKGEMRAADLLRAVHRNKSRVWVAIGQLVASGRVVRRRETGSRSFYSLANTQPTETLQ